MNDRGEQDKDDGVCGQLSLCVNGMTPAQAAGDGCFSLGHFIRHRVKKLETVSTYVVSSDQVLKKLETILFPETVLHLDT